MKEKFIEFLKSKLLFAFIINFIILICCIEVTSFSYDSIKDFYNSVMICQNHFYYSDKINYIFANITGSLQFILNGFNCYVLGLIGLSFIAFVSISFVFADRYNKKISLLFTLLINILFAVNHYANIEISKTSALVLAAGFLLVLNAIRNKRYSLPCWIGVCEVALGSFLCFEYFFIALAFSVAYFLADMISKRKYKIPLRKFFWYFRPFLLMFALVTAVVIGLNQYSVSVNNANPDTADYYTYSKLSNSINSLPYPSYKGHSEDFKNVGIESENEYELLKNGYYDSSTSLNNNTLKLVHEIQLKENSKTYLGELQNIFIDNFIHFAGFDTFAIIIIVYFALSVIYIVFQKRRFCFFPIFYLITAIITGIYLRYCFLATTSLMYGIWLLMFIMLLNSFDFNQKRPTHLKAIKFVEKNKVLISYVCIAVLLCGFVAVYHTHQAYNDEGKKTSGLISELKRHPERYYVFDPDTAKEYVKSSDNYIHPLWGFDSLFFENIDSFGYYHKPEELFRRNLTANIYESVLDGNKIYVIDNGITFKKEKYFTQFYAEDSTSAKYNQIDEINGFKIYRVLTSR